ncbi:MAG: peptide chain release factor 2 [Candidatus Hydrogenedentota bacterium]
MYEDESLRLTEYAERLVELRRCLNVETAKQEIVQLETAMGADGFWDDQDNAKKTMQRVKVLKSLIDGPDLLERDLADGLVLVELAQGEGDETMAQELQELATGLEDRLRRLEMSSLFSDPRDPKNAIINIHPGAGGTESCDWADILYRMMVRCCERHDFSVEVVDFQPGDEAGLKGASIVVEGPFAYGTLKSESGVHRLVRISPFDSQSRRHTSFAAIEVLPQADEDVDIEIKDEDVKMEVFRSSGPGGQKVNKTSSAVRLIHGPTGIVVSCQIERSQTRNREVAMQMLKSKLYDIEVKKKEAEMAALRDGQSDVAWGSQIRSYVLHPYQMIKDHRTNVETGNVERTLDGDLDMFIEAYLKWKLEKKAIS